MPPISLRIGIGVVCTWNTGEPVEPAIPVGPAAIGYSFVDNEALLPNRISWSLASAWSEIDNILLTAGDNTHNITGLQWNTQYEVRNVEVNGAVESSLLTVDLWTSPANTPTGLAAVATGTNSIGLSWNALTSEPASTGGGYEIEISDDSGATFGSPEVVLSGTHTLSWTGLLDDTRYDFRIRAFNVNPSPHDDGVTDWSSAVNATTDSGSFFFLTDPEIVPYGTFQFDTQPEIVPYP